MLLEQLNIVCTIILSAPKGVTIVCFQPKISKKCFHFLNSWLLMLPQRFLFYFQTQRHHYQPLLHFLQTQCLHGSCLLGDSCENHKHVELYFNYLKDNP